MFLPVPFSSVIALLSLGRGNQTYIHVHVYVRITLPLGETELASGSDVNGSTESFEMVIEEPSMDSAVKQSLEGKNMTNGLY